MTLGVLGVLFLRARHIILSIIYIYIYQVDLHVLYQSLCSRITFQKLDEMDEPSTKNSQLLIPGKTSPKDYSQKIRDEPVRLL